MEKPELQHTEVAGVRCEVKRRLPFVVRRGDNLDVRGAVRALAHDPIEVDFTVKLDLVHLQNREADVCVFVWGRGRWGEGGRERERERGRGISPSPCTKAFNTWWACPEDTSPCIKYLAKTISCIL